MRYFPITCTHKKSGISTLALMFFVSCQNQPQGKSISNDDVGLNGSANLPQDITPFLEANHNEETPEILQVYAATDIISDSESISLALMNLKANHGVHFVEGPFRIITDPETGDKKTIEELELDESVIQRHIESKVIDTGTTVYEIRHEIKNQMNVTFAYLQTFNGKYTDYPYVLELDNGTRKTINSSSDLPKELRSHVQEHDRYVTYIQNAKAKLMSLKFPQDESGQPVSTTKSTPF
jgi:hypothetical protein